MKRILIANRGEIAARVARTARAMGYEVAAVYSEADAHTAHVREADAAMCIGPAPVGESYLRVDRLLEACAKMGADAVHPGYGFLSERADFARQVTEAGLTWIGPGAGAIEAMGDKAAAKRMMIEAGVPCVPGYEGDEQSDEALTAHAERVGFPLMIKAAAGGGGRGMRRVASLDEVPAALRSARSEAANAFGDGTLLLEREVVGARHVEIQVFADTHGRVVHLGERDCSVQRRHQKVLEEAPCPVMTPELRERMGRAACDAARAVGYVGAGTVEFLVDADLAFYFLEMNTRLQVEHRVTELAYDVDLVRWQLMVAEGGHLPEGDFGGAPSRAVIEARVYAEDPSRGFLPQTGVMHGWETYDVRDERTGRALVVTDHDLAPGAEVSPFYDPMLAKVVAVGHTRSEALRVCASALRKMVALGVGTNREFLLECLEHPTFVAGGATTSFVDGADLDTTRERVASADEVTLGAALTVWAGGEGRSFSSASALPRALALELDGQEHRVLVTEDGSTYEVERDGITTSVELASASGARVRARMNDVWETLAWAKGSRGEVHWQRAGVAHTSADLGARPPQVAGGASDGTLRAPMSGRVLDVRVAPGDEVEAGSVLVVLEAMKMEHELEAPLAGKAAEVCVGVGDQVDAGALLVALE